MKNAKLIELFNLVPPTGKFKSPQSYRVYSKFGLSPTLNTCNGGNREPKVLENMANEKERPALNLPEGLKGRKFRIRKLTPCECFRLMDVDDADIDKIQATGLSNSAQYRLAGNSIVVNVLFHIFRKMFIETDEEVEAGTQLTLF